MRKLLVFQPNKKWVLLIVFISGIMLGGAIFFYQVVESLFIIWQDNQRVPCDQLPTMSQAEQIYNEHLDTVEQIENISPGKVFVSLVERSPGKGEVEIEYDTMSTRNQIKDLIGGTFFGIPYIMHNV
ncbi:MAG: hypothetical protein JSW11_10445 [Candidatus Heimdallarchaeota archaeon]|nr:MAG: hypothetical protein JSW11_10445 [Candidatus Heimdallarchaeota archaeon]